MLSCTPHVQQKRSAFPKAQAQKTKSTHERDPAQSRDTLGHSAEQVDLRTSPVLLLDFNSRHQSGLSRAEHRCVNGRSGREGSAGRSEGDEFLLGLEGRSNGLRLAKGGRVDRSEEAGRSVSSTSLNRVRGRIALSSWEGNESSLVLLRHLLLCY